ncbi:MAG: TolC family protein [Tenuifilaceae bacterium]|jgi:outer membrane protein TolC|nr:TolC family protein [Tenuifilaceae bacterium]
MFLKKKLLAVSLVLLTASWVAAQAPKTTLTLNEVLEMARDYSPQAILAKHQFRAAYWEHRTYKAEYLPSITLNGTLPSFNRSLIRYQLEDGTYRYIEENSNTASVGLSLNQNIGVTGGRIFASSNLERTDFFGANKGTNFMSVPIQIGFSQPIFGFNEFKWKRKIEPLKYLEAKRSYIQSMENIAGEAIRYFFDLVLAQQNLQTAQLNYANTDTLYQIAKGRYNIGTIAENELLQMELSYLNAGSSVNEAEIDLQLKKFRLKSFLGIIDDYDVELIVPNYFPKTTLRFDHVYTLAKENNPTMIQFERRLIESDRNVAQAKANRGFSANLYATYGLTQRAEEFQNVYVDPMDQQGIRVGLTVPILDWGLGKGRVKMAESSREVMRTNIQQSLTDFEQDIYLKVMEFNLQETQMQLASKADTIAQSRYNVTKERFLIGKIDVIELNIAQTERDNARNRYIAAMRNYWQFYYEMRKLTQFDFIQEKPLEVEFEALIQ